MNRHAPELIDEPKHTSHQPTRWGFARLLVPLFMLAMIGMYVVGVFEFPQYAARPPG